jgi:hypothetical protein
MHTWQAGSATSSKKLRIRNTIQYNTIQLISFLPHWHTTSITGSALASQPASQPRSPLPFPNFAQHTTMLEYEYQKKKNATEGEIAPRAFLALAPQYTQLLKDATMGALPPSIHFQ